MTFETDDALKLGEFGIQARLVRAAEAATASRSAEQGDHGHTMVYSTSDRLREELDQPARARADRPRDGARRGQAHASSARPARCSAAAATATSSLADPNVSRHHAEIRPDGRGGWIVEDLGLDERREGQRPPDHGRRRRWSRATASRSGTADVRFVVE